MAEPAPGPHKPTSDPTLLREDLGKEYYAVLGLLSSYDGWLLIVKGWSVTLSLAALGLGFQQRHYALFALAALTGAAFWFLDGLMKGYQYRYYIRMREIEYTAYLINRVRFDSPEYGDWEISAPRIDMIFGFRGYLFAKNDKGEYDKNNPLVDEHGTPWPHPLWRREPRPPKKKSKPGSGGTKRKADWRPNEPERRNPEKIYADLRARWGWANVMLPHVVAVVLGLLLFIISASLNAAGVGHLPL